MSVLLLVSFVVFVLCCFLQIWYLKKVRDALIDRHPKTFLEIEKSILFPVQGLWKFTRSSRYKRLEDEELNQHVRNLKRFMVVAYSLWILYAVTIFATPMPTPQLPISAANGYYTNVCCGTLFLENGRMKVLNQYVSYVVERDKVSPYVLPSVYIGASARGLVVDRSDNSLILRLNHQINPTNIELMDKSDGVVISFHRLPGT
jgi:hypothetical protein